MCTKGVNVDTRGNSVDNDRLDYAWKWFEYHANQRISMFNYFLVASGILIHAYVSLVEGKCFEMAVGLAIIGTLISFSFFALDCRNAQLVYWGEDVLRRLEHDLLFVKNFDGLAEKKRQTKRGILLRDLSCSETKWTKHKIWLRVIEILIFVCFVFALVYAFCML